MICRHPLWCSLWLDSSYFHVTLFLVARVEISSGFLQYSGTESAQQPQGSIQALLQGRFEYAYKMESYGTGNTSSTSRCMLLQVSIRYLNLFL